MNKIKSSLSLIIGFVAFVLFAVTPVFTHAQRNNFLTYSVNDNLPNATINCITQDSRGYLWLGTGGGGLC